MILTQLIRTLPASSAIKILDEHKPVLEFTLAAYDKTPIFKNIDNDIKYHKIYQFFHVELVDKIDDIWVINVR